MAAVALVGDLQIDEDIPFQRRSWTVQRVGWAVMAVLIVAGLVGLLGPGLLSEGRAGAAGDPLQVAYHHMAHWQTPTSLTVELTPLAAHDGLFRVWLGREFIEQANIERIMPPPVRVEAGADRHTYVFAADQAGSPTAITIHLLPEQVGRLRGQAGVDDGPPVTFDVWILP